MPSETPRRGGAGRGQGRRPLGPSPTLTKSVTLTQDDIDYLRTIDPDNLSNAIRILIARARQG
jgi:hypothetical protein